MDDKYKINITDNVHFYRMKKLVEWVLLFGSFEIFIKC